MDKQTEIKLIVKLSDKDSYFADTFTQDDIDKMIKNIQNDFPILQGTFVDDIAEERERLFEVRKELEARIEQRDNALNDMIREAKEMKSWKKLVWKVLHREDREELNELFTVDENIEFKLKNGIGLSPEEGARVLSRMQ